MGGAGECCGTEMAQPNSPGEKLFNLKERQQSVASSRFLVTAVVTQTQNSLEAAILPSGFPIAAHPPNTCFLSEHTQVLLNQVREPIPPRTS